MFENETIEQLTARLYAFEYGCISQDAVSYELGQRGAIDILIHALKTGKWHVRHSVTWALRDTNDERVIEPLAQAMLHDENEHVRAAAAKSVCVFMDSRLFEPFVTALKDTYSDVRYMAALTLGAMGDKRAIEPLRALLDDPDVERIAREAIVKLGGIP